MASPDATLHARRALEGHASMLARFERRDGTLRRDGRVRLPLIAAHLWPFARAFVATLDVAGMPAPLRAGSAFDPDAVIARRLCALERYWDGRGPAYASDPPGVLTRLLRGGDIYYDDNAWAGLALVQLARLRPGAGRLDRATRLADFARAGWDDDPRAPHPGGVFWVQQGTGLGAHNHDRNAISTAPNGELILHLAALAAEGSTVVGAEGPGAGPAPPTAPKPTPEEMAAWVSDTLGNDDGLVRDKIRGDGTIDAALWSYNQGSMLGLHALLSERATRDAAAHLERAEALATTALRHYGERRWTGEPVEFIAILMRNLLLLSARSRDTALRQRIAEALRDRADAAWPIAPRATLLEHSAVVTLQALTTWAPEDHHLLA